MKIKKPIDSIHEISNSMISSRDSINILLTKGSSIELDYNKYKNIFFLESGRVSINRILDKKIVISADSPAIIGLTTLYSNCHFHYLYAESDCSMLSIKSDLALDIFRKQNLWESVTAILGYVANLAYERDDFISYGNVYQVIKAHLELLWDMPEDQRLRYSIFDFILNRTSASRSSLNKVIKELELGGYIQTSRGKLLNVKKLPHRF